MTWGNSKLLMLLIVAGSLIDTLNGKTEANPVIEIRGERIISASSDVQAPPEATVLPGLSDMHLTYEVTVRIGL